jgi:hypothetical protein
MACMDGARPKLEAELSKRLLAAGLARFVAPKSDSIEAKLIQMLHAACAGQSAGRGGKHVLIACMPKSASTFLTNAIANLPDFNNVGLGFLNGRREQELCLFRCSLVHNLNYVTQAHVRFSNSTESILKTFDIFPVILVRNIFDCVVSICDHLHNESLEGSMAYFPPRILKEPLEKQYDAIIDLMVPWYANFFACWSDYKGPGLRVSYDEVAENLNGVISRAMRETGYEASPTAIDDAITKARAAGSRFNVGKSGRGAQQLSAKQIARIVELFSYYSHLDGVEELLRVSR